MKNGRRDFIKTLGLSGLAWAGAGMGQSHASALNNQGGQDLVQANRMAQKSHVQRFNMSGYAAPKIDTVRIGIIGTGNRGSHHAGTISRIGNVEIKAAADVRPERFERIKANLKNTGHSPEYYAGSEDEWSVLNNSNSIKVPDFTANAWTKNKPNMDINLENGCGNTPVLK
jgi:hypothetical protein